MLAVIELSDVIFAVDSIPAIFGVTLDPVIVYTSNMAAILSLRALYGFIASVISELRCGTVDPLTDIEFCVFRDPKWRLACLPLTETCVVIARL